MILQGIGVGTGIGIGRVIRMPDPIPEPEDVASKRTPAEEIERAETAVAMTADELKQRAAIVTGPAKDVLDAQVMMSADPALLADVKKRIGTGKTAERAVFEAIASFRDMFLAMGGYMAERATDLNDVSQRIRAHVMGVRVPGVPESASPFVLVARDLAPADTALLDIAKVVAIVTEEGSPTAHTSILARSMSIPALVGVKDALTITDGTRVIVNSGEGLVELNPTDEEIAYAQKEIESRAARAEAPPAPGSLGDGTPVLLAANLGKPEDAANALALGAEGVGLFRTEVMFLDSEKAPTVEQQETAFKTVFDTFPGKKVVIRALDAGADKPLAFLNDTPEENPALGVRGIRVLRTHEDVLKSQLQAIANAANGTKADVWVMAPMVATVEEAKYFADLVHGYGLKMGGVMVETPAAALLADKIFDVADFASIGTNDLTQYTMAADRLLGAVGNLQNPWHPAVLKLVGMVGAAGAEKAHPVGICGEAAADPLLAVVLVGLGATSLSMSPGALADVRFELAKYSKTDAERLAKIALEQTDAATARAAVATEAQRLVEATLA